LQSVGDGDLAPAKRGAAAAGARETGMKADGGGRAHARAQHRSYPVLVALCGCSLSHRARGGELLIRGGGGGAGGGGGGGDSGHSRLLFAEAFSPTRSSSASPAPPSLGIPLSLGEQCWGMGSRKAAAFGEPLLHVLSKRGDASWAPAKHGDVRNHWDDPRALQHSPQVRCGGAQKSLSCHIRSLCHSYSSV